jgi:effector-binding domain-containing protein
MAENGELLTIGNFSLFTKLSHKALRLYEEKGLLLPAKKEITGYRMYSYAQIVTGLRLRALSEIGFSLQEMREAMNAIESGDSKQLEDLVELKIGNIDNKIERLLEARRQLENNTMFEMMEMKNEEAFEKEIPPVRVVSMRGKGEYQEIIPLYIQNICSTISRQEQARFSGPPMVIYHDPEYKEKNADVEVVVPVTGRVTVGDDMEVKTLEATKVVSVIHKGPYSQVGKAWAKAAKYAQEKKIRKTLDQCRELYLNDPKDVPESELLTEVQLRFE